MVGHAGVNGMFRDVAAVVSNARIVAPRSTERRCGDPNATVDVGAVTAYNVQAMGCSGA